MLIHSILHRLQSQVSAATEKSDMSKTWQQIAETYRHERDAAIRERETLRASRDAWNASALDWQSRCLRLQTELEKHGLPIPEDVSITTSTRLAACK
jgi:hypothetical protein